MKISAISVLIFLLYNLNLTGQTRTITGRVISEDFEPIPMLEVLNSDAVHLGKTDMDGFFTISIPQETGRLLFSYIGMEWNEIKLRKDCDTIEVVMMYDGTYDFMTLRKVDRLRKKRFDNLPSLHSDAVKKDFLTITLSVTKESLKHMNQLNQFLIALRKNINQRENISKILSKDLLLVILLRFHILVIGDMMVLTEQLCIHIRIG